MIKKVWKVDPLICPKSTGEMRIISFINKKTVIKNILIHPRVYDENKNQRAPPAATSELPSQLKLYPKDDEWPGYDEPVFDFQETQRLSINTYAQIGCQLAEYGVVIREIAGKENESGKNNGKN